MASLDFSAFETNKASLRGERCSNGGHEKQTGTKRKRWGGAKTAAAIVENGPPQPHPQHDNVLFFGVRQTPPQCRERVRS